MMLRLAKYLARQEWVRVLLRCIEPISFVQTVRVLTAKEMERESTVLFYALSYELIAPHEHHEICQDFVLHLHEKGIRANIVQASYKGVDTKAPPVPTPAA